MPESWSGPIRAIKIWAGDNELVSGTLKRIGWDYTYPVILQVTDGDSAINGETIHVEYKSNPDIWITFPNNDSITHWISDIRNYAGTQSEFFKGMVVALVTLPEAQGNYEVEFSVYDSAGIEKISDTLTFYNKGDDEASGLFLPYSHALNVYGDEILGDGLYGSNDTSSTKKDVFIEIDYLSQFTVTIADTPVVVNINSSDITSIKNEIKSCLMGAKYSGQIGIYPCGTDIYFENSTTFPSMSNSLNRKDRLELYRLTRNSTRAIHLILGTATDPNDYPKKQPNRVTLGFTDDYGGYFRGNPDTVGGLGMDSDSADILCAKYATVGDSMKNAQYYLNSTGCFVSMKTLIHNHPSLLDSTEIRNKAIAICAAHEIGHALGLNHWNYQYADSNKEEKNLMFWEFEEDSLGKHDFLIFEHLRGYAERDSLGQSLEENGRYGLNTFSILGRNTVDTYY